MPSFKAVVTASVGLHARPAAAFVRAVTDTGFPVVITKDGMSGVDARSLLQVMSADFQQGCEVELSIRDATLDSPESVSNAREALAFLASLLESQGARQEPVRQ